MSLLQFTVTFTVQTMSHMNCQIIVSLSSLADMWSFSTLPKAKGLEQTGISLVTDKENDSG